MKRILLAVSAAFSLAAASGAHAAAILYWADSTLGADAMAQALLDSGHTITTSTDEADFVSDVGAGGWDLVVFMNQNSTNASAKGAISNWVTGGGRAIFADWLRDAAPGAAFNASYPGATNGTDVTVTSPALALGLSSNPLTLSNPGWSIFSMSMDAEAGGTSAGIFGDGTDAIIIGNAGLTIINGFLNDTFGGFDGPDFSIGVSLYLNEIGLLLEGGTVPEPGSLALLGLGLFGLAAARRRTKRS